MGGGATRSVMTDSLNQILATSFLSVTTKCQINQTLQQEIDINCNGEGDQAGTYYEENEACQNCYNNILEQQVARYNALQATWGADRNIPVSFNQEYINMVNTAQGCKNKCKACVFSNFSQQSTYSWDAKCMVTTADENKFTNSLQENLNQALTDNQDVLSSLARVLGASDKQSTVANIVNRLKSNFSATFLNTLAAKVSDTQKIVIRKGSGITDNGDTQQSSIRGVTSLFAQTNVANNVLSDEQWAIYQKLYNDENTIGDLGNMLANTALGIGDIVKTLAGKLVIVVAAVLVLVVILITVVVIVNAVRKRKESPVITGR